MQATVKAGTRPPWVGFAAAVWVGIAAGNSYCFPLYSHALKSVLGYSQQQLTILGVANDFGENTGILPGIACNYFPPRVVLLVGLFSSFLSSFLVYDVNCFSTMLDCVQHVKKLCIFLKNIIDKNLITT